MGLTSTITDLEKSLPGEEFNDVYQEVIKDLLESHIVELIKGE